MSPEVLAAMEVATEGSEDLDRLIYEAVGAEQFFDCTYMDSDMPPFSTSLDAALTLVPEGHGIEMYRYWRAEPGEWWSVMLRWGISGGHVIADDVPTAPLALCIAALRLQPPEPDHG